MSIYNINLGALSNLSNRYTKKMEPSVTNFNLDANENQLR